MKQFPRELARILTDENIVKVGVNIRGDGTRLMKDWGIRCASLVELGAISIQTMDDQSNQRKIRSMDRLARELLGYSVEKDTSARMSDWSSSHLTMAQIAYAANDVYVSYEIAAKIKRMQKNRPSQEYHVPLMTITTDGADVRTVQGMLSVFKDKNNNNTNNNNNKAQTNHHYNSDLVFSLTTKAHILIFSVHKWQGGFNHQDPRYFDGE
ncbi:hypothetical protein BGZ65_012094 [Modicella reniformis]|uniref:3'-5' exonuclease n=1 Tax=Modicella reniformis TaxID=1440133 RepID=A0A9P6MD37_9FUNG|nr:hypothetical protein BGZ65_012094 [Modicella reniformis]